MNTLVEKHIKYLEDKTFFVPAILEDEETFEEFRVNMYQMFKDGFEVKELREAPAKFIFKLDEEPHEMQVRRFYINLLMWYPLCLFGCPNDIDESFIVDDFTAGARINYFNEFHRCGIPAVFFDYCSTAFLSHLPSLFFMGNKVFNGISYLLRIHWIYNNATFIILHHLAIYWHIWTEYRKSVFHALEDFDDSQRSPFVTRVDREISKSITDC